MVEVKSISQQQWIFILVLLIATWFIAKKVNL